MESKACSSCGHVGTTDTYTPGSRFIELLLWLLFIVPGLIYSLWRRSAQREVCARCGAANPLPLDTPRGRAIAEDSGIAAPPAVRPSAAAYGMGRSLGRIFRRR